jgi:hypothetical protein
MNIDGTIGNKYQGPVLTRPYDFGTDAIERQRVSLGQSLIDADFEYGLQATKWQTYTDVRRFPSFFEIPGTDFPVMNVVTNSTSNVVVFFANTSATVGSVISVTGLSNQQRTAERAEGYFIVTAQNTSANTSNYTSKGVFSTTSNIQTWSTVIKKVGAVNSGLTKISLLSVGGASTSNIVISTPTPHGLLPGTPILVSNSSVTANGNYIVSTVPTSNTMNIQNMNSTIISGVTTNANIYISPWSYNIHRPFDGGVLLSPNIPTFGASICRQSKKVFRYQSGKGLLWSSGTLFCPNNDIASVTYTNSVITITTDIPHGCVTSGPTIIVKGIASPTGINGSYTVASVVDSQTLTVATPAAYTSSWPATATTANLGDQPRFGVSRWAGSSTRAGCFEDQNGLFWEYDGQTLFAVKRSSTLQLTGTVTVNPNAQIMYSSNVGTNGTLGGSPTPFTPAIGDTSITINASGHTLVNGMYTTDLGGGGTFLGPVWVIGTPTASSVTLGFAPAQQNVTISGAYGTNFQRPTSRFQDQLRVNDRFVLRGMTHQVTSILGQGIVTFNPPYRGATIVPSDETAKIAKVKEIRIPQSQFNRDHIDGTGPSGFRVDLTKMQMVGIQYTWYGAGFVDFMIRGSDGNWVYCHRIANNNVNDEAYMRTGNMPVRYEIVNENQSAVTTLATSIASGDQTLVVNDDTRYFPSAGTLVIDNEFVGYTGKTSNSFTGCTRALTFSNQLAGATYPLIGQTNTSHLSNTTVFLGRCTVVPSLTHWGSALLMDGQFDSDRGYFFNYSNTAVTVANTRDSASIAFMIRLAPSVSNGIVGDIGDRDLLNRAQLLLQKLEVTSNVNLNVTGILNPTGVTLGPSGWQNVNSAALGSQPSFTQIAVGVTGTPVPGETIFSTIVQANNQNNLDLSGLKEMCNSVIGGKQSYPDGPDILCIQVKNLATVSITPSVQVNLFWTEAQA